MLRLSTSPATTCAWRILKLMRFTPVLAIAVVALAGTASAQTDFVVADRKLVDPEKAAVLCSPQESRFRIVGIADDASVDAGFKQRFVVDYQAMMVTQPGLQHEDEPYRAWSRRASIACGRYTIEIEAGFYNINPYGRMGAAKDYPRVAVSADDFLVVRWTSLAPCKYANNEGLRDNAQVVEGRWLTADEQTEVTRTIPACGTTPAKRVTSRAKTVKQLSHQRPVSP